MLKKLTLCAALTLAAMPFACVTSTTPDRAPSGNYSALDGGVVVVAPSLTG
jgi:hypothetical protein